MALHAHYQQQTALDVAAPAMLAAPDSAVLFGRLAPAAANSILRGVTAIYSDVDGTLVPEGATALGEAYIEVMRRLARRQIAITLVTGKPYEEITPLVSALPDDLPIQVLYEKGAYYLAPAASGGFEKRYILSSPAHERAVAELHALFQAEQRSIQDRHRTAAGKPQFIFGWGGTGTHQSVLSIDIYADVPPADYLTQKGVERDGLKVHDPAALAAAEDALEQFARQHQPGWRVVHLGNGNTEISPQTIEKDRAIRALQHDHRAGHTLVLGDSANDQQMFALRDQRRIWAGLVLHRDKAVPLVAKVDFVSFGMANALPYFALIDALLQR